MKQVIICPGGGYRLIGTNEGEPVAAQFRNRGYEASVLNYAVGDRAIFTEAGFSDFEPIRELEAAMTAARASTGSEGQVVLVGFSAGAHLSAGYCLSHSIGEAADRLPMPDALLLSYPAFNLGSNPALSEKVFRAFDIAADIRDFGIPKRAENLPVFIWHSTTDELVPYENTVAFMELLRNRDFSAEFSTFHEGRHGDPSTTPGWFETSMKYIDREEA